MIRTRTIIGGYFKIKNSYSTTTIALQLYFYISSSTIPTYLLKKIITDNNLKILIAQKKTTSRTTIFLFRYTQNRTKKKLTKA